MPDLKELRCLGLILGGGSYQVLAAVQPQLRKQLHCLIRPDNHAHNIAQDVASCDTEALDDACILGKLQRLLLAAL